MRDWLVGTETMKLEITIGQDKLEISKDMRDIQRSKNHIMSKFP